MVVDYQPHWMKDTGHFEFRSPHQPPRRIPVSETGYRSHFGDMDEIEAMDSPQEYARMVVLAQLRGQPKAPVEADEELPGTRATSRRVDAAGISNSTNVRLTRQKS